MIVGDIGNGISWWLTSNCIVSRAVKDKFSTKLNAPYLPLLKFIVDCTRKHAIASTNKFPQAFTFLQVRILSRIYFLFMKIIGKMGLILHVFPSFSDLFWHVFPDFSDFFLLELVARMRRRFIPSQMYREYQFMCRRNVLSHWYLRWSH